MAADNNGLILYPPSPLFYYGNGQQRTNTTSPKSAILFMTTDNNGLILHPPSPLFFMATDNNGLTLYPEKSVVVRCLLLGTENKSPLWFDAYY